jgi:hypothetical protein
MTHCSCPVNVLKIALLPTSNTCTVPSSLPATTNFPSFLNSALLAVALNLDIVLTTFPVLGAYINTLVDEDTAYRCGRVGQKWTWVIGAGCRMNSGCLN